MRSVIDRRFFVIAISTEIANLLYANPTPQEISFENRQLNKGLIDLHKSVIKNQQNIMVLCTVYTRVQKR